MSKLRLEFDMSDPDDKQEFEVKYNAQRLLLSVYEFDQDLRSGIKYGSTQTKKYTEAQQELLQEIRELLHKHLNNNDIDLDRLMV